MSEGKSINWLGKSKEKSALKLCKDHMNKIVEVSELTNEAIKLFGKDKGKFQNAAQKVMEGEKAADEKKSEVLRELSKGNFPPLSREMIIRLLLTTDDIGDNSRAAAMKLSFLDPDKIDDEIIDNLEELSKFLKKSSKNLKETFSLLLEDPETAIDKTEEVEDIEEEADDFKNKTLIPSLVEWADKSKTPGTSYMLVEVGNNVEEAVDRTENAADIIREIAIRTI